MSIQPMSQQELEKDNPFTSKYVDTDDVGHVPFDEYKEEQKKSYEEKILVALIGEKKVRRLSLQKNYQKLSETYQDVVKMASTYFDEETEEALLDAEARLYYT